MKLIDDVRSVVDREERDLLLSRRVDTRGEREGGEQRTFPRLGKKLPVRACTRSNGQAAIFPLANEYGRLGTCSRLSSPGPVNASIACSRRAKDRVFQQAAGIIGWSLRRNATTSESISNPVSRDGRLFVRNNIVRRVG